MTCCEQYPIGGSELCIYRFGFQSIRIDFSISMWRDIHNIYMCIDIHDININNLCVTNGVYQQRCLFWFELKLCEWGGPQARVWPMEIYWIAHFCTWDILLLSSPIVSIRFGWSVRNVCLCCIWMWQHMLKRSHDPSHKYMRQRLRINGTHSWSDIHWH